MKHCIIVKFDPSVEDKEKLIGNIEAMFRSEAIPEGTYDYAFLPCCIDRPNRYDLAIVVTMDKAGLIAWDSSTVHHRWKVEFGSFVAQKAIFDFED